MEEAGEKSNERLETLVAILIAVVIAIAAVVAWRASVADDAAGDFDFEGMRSLVDAENTDAINHVMAYVDYGSYLNYWRNSNLVDLLGSDMETTAEDQQPVLQEQLNTASTLADATSSFFEMRYLNRDGSYDVQRQLGALWADAQREKDLEFESKFASADRLRNKTRSLLIALMILSIAPVLFSLVESVSRRMQYVLIGLGVLFMVAGTILAVVVDLM
jgi:hypothetical protein